MKETAKERETEREKEKERERNRGYRERQNTTTKLTYLNKIFFQLLISVQDSKGNIGDIKLQQTIDDLFLMFKVFDSNSTEHEWPDVSGGFTIVACSFSESGKNLKSSLALNPAIILLKQLWYCFLVYLVTKQSVITERGGGEKIKTEREI